MRIFFCFSYKILTLKLFSAFVDVSPDETLQKSPFENYDVRETSTSEDNQALQEVSFMVMLRIC